MTSGTGPSLGSVRVIGAAVRATVGDRLRLDFNVPEGRVLPQRLPADDGTAAEEAPQIAREVAHKAAPNTGPARPRARPPRRRRPGQE